MFGVFGAFWEALGVCLRGAWGGVGGVPGEVLGGERRRREGCQGGEGRVEGGGVRGGGKGGRRV